MCGRARSRRAHDRDAHQALQRSLLTARSSARIPRSPTTATQWTRRAAASATRGSRSEALHAQRRPSRPASASRSIDNRRPAAAIVVSRFVVCRERRFVVSARLDSGVCVGRVIARALHATSHTSTRHPIAHFGAWTRRRRRRRPMSARLLSTRAARRESNFRRRRLGRRKGRRVSTSVDKRPPRVHGRPRERALC